MAGWMEKLRNVSTGTLLLMVSAASLIVSLLLTIALTAYVRHEALHDVAREDVQQTSLIIFQSLYGSMSKGGDRRKMEAVVADLGRTFPHLNVGSYTTTVYRSPLVASQYGARPGDLAAIERDPDLKRAMTGGLELLLFPTNSAVRNLYPIRARQECLECHKDARPGDIFGVIDVTYPVNELRVSFMYMMHSMLGYTLLTLAVAFTFLYLALRTLVAIPLRDFAATVRTIDPELKTPQGVTLRHRVAELRQLAEDFNHLLGTIGVYQAKLVQYSTTDTLTGLMNRRQFEDRLDDEIARSNRYGSRFAVLMLDVDDFKHINDSYGHPVGDLALQKIAEVMRTALRGVDTTARLGGDEFAAIVPETEGKDAVAAAQRLRAHLNASPLKVEAGEIRITCSIGVASYPRNAPERTRQALYKTMDDMLYQAKRLGKDQVAAAE